MRWLGVGVARLYSLGAIAVVCLVRAKSFQVAFLVGIKFALCGNSELMGCGGAGCRG